jgi:hypothetical protein
MGILSDVEGLRRRAQKHVEAGAVTDEYDADRAEVVETLNTVLATDLMCVLRYKRHYYTAKGFGTKIPDVDLRRRRKRISGVSPRPRVPMLNDSIRTAGSYFLPSMVFFGPATSSWRRTTYHLLDAGTP